MSAAFTPSHRLAPSTPSQGLFRPAQRILSLHFPHLPTDRIARARWGRSWLSAGRPDHPPLVFSAKRDNAMRIVALDRLAESLALSCGQGLAEARAMHPQIEVLAADPAADAAFLNALADWCDRYTPLIALDGTDGLHLDITGCAHLHRGEQALIDDVLARLFELGVETRGAIASSAALAGALARQGVQGVVAPGEEEAALAPLPVAALRLPQATVDMLVRLGLNHAADLLQAPRAALARRFGPVPFLRLDQALGFDEEPLSPRLPVASLSAERRLAEPVSSEEDILGLTQKLAMRLKVLLEGRAEGGRLFELLLFRVDGKVFRLKAGTSTPLRDPPRIAALYRERLAAVHDALDAGFGFELLRLSVLKAEAFAAVQDDFSGRPDQGRSLADFADRVMARFGADSLSVSMPTASHVPERAAPIRPLGDWLTQSGQPNATLALPALSRQGGPAGPGPGRGRPLEAGPPRQDMSAWPIAAMPVRPLRMLKHPEPVEVHAADVPDGPPERFSWRRAVYRVARAEGPERIAAEWWIDGEEAPTRDYFRIEDEAGRRFWMFRNGLFGRERAHPGWFMHGIFA